MADVLPEVEIKNATGGQDTAVAIEDGQTGSGLKTKVAADADGNNRVFADALANITKESAGNFYVNAALGNIPGVSVLGVQGHNDAVASTGEDLVGNGGTYNFPAAAAILDIVSDDATDELVGAGARTLLIEGLDGSYNSIQEVVNMNGTTIVNTLQSFLRVHRTTMIACGGDTFNNGTITVTNGSDIISSIMPGDGISQDAVFTVPADKVALFSEAFIVSETNGLQIRVRTFAENGCRVTPVIIDMGEPVFNFVPRQPLVIQEKTDFKIFVDPNSGSKSVSAIVNVILVDV